jgi:hypothetical protein
MQLWKRPIPLTSSSTPNTHPQPDPRVRPALARRLRSLPGRGWGTCPGASCLGVVVSTSHKDLYKAIRSVVAREKYGMETHSTTNLPSLALAFLSSSASTLARLSASRSARAYARSSSVCWRAVLLLLVLPGYGLVVERGGIGGGVSLLLLLSLSLSLSLLCSLRSRRSPPSSEKIRPMLERGFWIERSKPPTASNSSSCMPVP